MNMSYCRFYNTSNDLDDCYENMDDNDLSESEEEAKKDLIKKCIEIAIDCGYMVNIELRKVEEN